MCGRMYARQPTPELLVVNALAAVMAITALPCGNDPVADSYEWEASTICFMLFWQLMRAAAARTFCTAGNSRPIRIAMMAMTTNSSISVNPPVRHFGCGAGRGIGTDRERDMGTSWTNER